MTVPTRPAETRPPAAAPTTPAETGPSATPSAITSPLRIPLPIDQISGGIFTDRLPDLIDSIELACGGTQCVSVTKVGDQAELPDGEACDTIQYVEDTIFPETGEPYVEVERGGTITVVVNVRCEDIPVDGLAGRR